MPRSVRRSSTCSGRSAWRACFRRCDSDDAVEVFEDLDEEFQHRILTALPQAYRHILEESLSYPEDSAGRIMQREVAVIPSAWTHGRDHRLHARFAEDLPDDFYDLYIVNPKHSPDRLTSRSAARSGRAGRSGSPRSWKPDMKVIPLTMDQEEVAYLFHQYGLVSAPVVDDAGRLVGVVTVDDVVHVIQEEAEEDIMKPGRRQRRATSTARCLDTTRARFPWLVVNLFTAILASIVIDLTFESRGGFPPDSLCASLAHAPRNQHHLEPCRPSSS